MDVYAAIHGISDFFPNCKDIGSSTEEGRKASQETFSHTYAYPSVL